MKNINWELSGLLPENGKLESYVKSINSIWIPPADSVEVELMECFGKDEFRAIYAFPESLKVTFPDGLIANTDITMELFNGLMESGWQIKTDANGLLDDLFALIGKISMIGDDIERYKDIIKHFSLKWGMMWKCERHENCILTPTYYINHFKSDCMFMFSERANDLLNLASSCKAALDISANINLNKQIPVEWWHKLYEPWKRMNFTPSSEKTEQKYLLSSVINYYISRAGSLNLVFKWSTQDTPDLTYETGLGFVHSAWLQVAQAISRTDAFTICDACGRAYIRQGRKPQQGRKNYCYECSGYDEDKNGKKLRKNRASKRLSAKKQRKAT